MEQFAKLDVDGHVGHLTDEQTAKLHQIRSRFCREHIDSTEAKAVATATAAATTAAATATAAAAAAAPGDSTKRDSAASMTTAAASRAPAFSVSPTTMRQAYHFHNQFDHPDAVFLRVLRARKWNVDQAYTMLLEVLGWRISFDVAGILTRGEPAIPRHLWDDGLGFIHGVDRSGRPICHVRIKHCHPSKQPVLQLQQFTVLCLENCRLFMHGSVEKYTILLDMAGFSLSNLDLSFVQWYVKAFSMYMPETLGLFVIYRAPWIFTPAWKIIAPWLDPVVAGKVVFVSSAEELQKVVDPKYLPVSVGGSYATEYSYEAPDKAEEELIDSIKKDADGREKALEKRIQAAEALDDVTRRLHAALDEKASAGDVDGLADERSKLSAEYTQAVVDLDYFIRGRTRYHRNGNTNRERISKWD